MAAARAYVLAGQHDKALRQAALVLEAEPMQAAPRALMAEARLGQGKLDDALVEIQQAIGREQRTEYYVILGNVQAARNQPADAVEAYAEALKRDPERNDIRYRRAVILVRTGAVKEGLRDLRRVVKVNPNLAEAYLHIGTALAGAGNESQALEAYRTAVVKNPKLAEAHYQIGVIAHDTRKMALAISSLKAAIANAGASDIWRADAHYLLGSAALSAGQNRLAIESFRTYLKTAPPSAASRKDALLQLRKLGALPQPGD